MISEDLLERGLADAASEYEVSTGAMDDIREQLMPRADDGDGDGEARPWTSWRPGKRGWLALAAAALVLLIVIPIAVGGGAGSDNHAELADSPTQLPASSIAGAGGGATTTAGSVAGAAAAPKSARQNGAYSRLSGGGAPAATPPQVTANDSVSGPVAPAPSVPDRVIKTGELDLQVPKGRVGRALDLIQGLATAQGGYVANSRTSEGSFAPSGSMTLRVPVAKFDDTVSKARHIAIDGIKVLSLQTSGKDVTAKYVDLKARIKALERTRQTFLTLLTRASTIGETLAVQQHITDVQTQIEQLKGQKNVLANRSALSTLTVTVDQKLITHATKPHHTSGIHKAFNRSVSRFVHGVEAIIGVIGPLLLALILIALAWVVARFGYRALRRRMV